MFLLPTFPVFYFLSLFCFRIRERTLLVGSLFVMFVGLFMYLPWGPGYPKITGKNNIDLFKAHNRNNRK